MAGKHTQRRQEQESEQEARISQLEQQSAPAPAAPVPAAAPAPAAAPVDVVGQLTKLKGLLDAGVLTQDEFDGQKRKLLQGG